MVAPAAAAAAILGGLLEPLDSPATHEAMPDWLLPHQADAVARVRAILRRFGGALVADGVGLGKTFIALALAVLERRSGGDAMAFVPAPLCAEWNRAAAGVGVPLVVHSHALLSRRTAVPPGNATLVLVDEAHAFRNPRTRRYDALARLVAGRRVALLSATPLNNTPADLAALVRLFAPRDGFREFGITDLEAALRRADPAASLALGALSVCRTRRLVEARFPELRGAFPRRVLREPVRYDLAACYGDSLGELLDALRCYAGAGDEPRGAALGHLVLLRRLESSRAAFRRSLARQRDLLDSITRAAEQGVCVTRAEVRTAWKGEGGGSAQLLLWPLLAGPGEEPAWQALAAARGAVDRALSLCDGLAGTPDAKAEALGRLLAGPLRGSRSIVFTEYRDTALHLLKALRATLRVVAVAGDAAWAGTTQLSRQEALDAFSPLSRGRRPSALLEADVLIATDVASEGLNLQDARAVVNYDLPWNPVRVMQRVGRIERLHSTHHEIEVAHLVPGGGLRELTAVLRTLRAKLDDTARTVGAEPDPLAALWWVEGGTPSPECVERESFRRVTPFEAREHWRSLAGPALARGSSAVIAAARTDDDGPPSIGVLLALEWRGGRRVPLPYVMSAAGPPRCDPQELGQLAERAMRAPALPVAAADLTGVLATILPEGRARLLELSASRHGGVEPGPGRRAALEVLARGAAEAHRLRRDGTRIDAAIALLARDLPEGLDRIVARLARGAGAPAELAQRIAELLNACRATGAPELSGPPRLVLVAALLLASRCPADERHV